MTTSRSENRKERRISLTRKSEIVQILEYNSWWIIMKTEILSAAEFLSETRILK